MRRKWRDQGLERLRNDALIMKMSAITRHLPWKQGDEEDMWAKKATDNLLKKLGKEDKELIPRMEDALEKKGTVPTQCVKIPRSLDGRLQISHRKALPHVIYCRVYRFPDLQTHHELKAIDACDFPYESGQKDVCINPYHYTRVEGVCVLPPVLVPRYSEQPPPQDMPLSFKRMKMMEAQSIMPDNIDIPLQMSTLNRNPIGVDEECDQAYSIPNHVQTVSVPYVDQDNWGTISYYELNTRVGEQVKVSESTVIVDGFTDPISSPGKISLGVFSNVNRNGTIENTRRNIGNGVKLTYVRDHCLLFAECQSDAAIFVQSRCCNYSHGFHPTAVCKLTNKTSLKIFDGAKFRQLLGQSSARGFDASYELTKMCIIRMSFVKGWGAEYQRQDVTSTPCWIEIHLHAPLMWLDSALSQITPSSKAINSMT